MKKRIIWLILSCLMVLSLVIASCGPAVTEEEEGVTEEEVVTEEEAVTEEEFIAEGAEMVVNTAGKLVERPRYGGWYYMSRTTDLRGFDDVVPASPAYATSTLNFTHDELYTGDWSKGAQGTDEASFLVYTTYFPHLEAPCLATGYELPDDETIIWHIRQGVYFHDKPPVNGRELNAHDIAFNLNRSFLTKGSYLCNTYRQDRDEGPISIEAIDDWTVEMKVPSARQVPILFASNEFVYHHAQEVIDQYGDASNWENCIGTGPFIMTDYVPVSSLTFERNPDYWRTNPLHPEDHLPYIDGVQIMIVPDASTAQAAFRVGKIETRAGLVKDDWEALASTNPELVWKQSMPTSAGCIYMRQDKPELPYDDIRVRKALFYGIDHQSIIDDYYEGLAEMICGPISGLPEYQAMYTTLEEYPEEVQKLYGFYPEEGRQLLAEAGYPDGFECTILAAAEGILPVIKDMWEKNLNVILNIDVRQSQVVSSIVMGSQQEDMYSGGIGGTVLKCNQWRTDSYINFSRIVNEEFNEWFEEFNASMLEWDKMCTMMKEMEPKMRAQAYFIDLPNDYTYYMWWPWIKSWSGEPAVGYFNSYQQLNYIWIDTELREELVGLAR